jgi:phosphoglycolate phosphatase
MNKLDELLSNSLFLFDIDGTILDSGGDGKRAYYRAFKDVCGIEIDRNINFLGGIDSFFFDTLYRRNNLPPEKHEKTWKSFKKRYSLLLEEYAQTGSWTLFDSVREVIKNLSAKSCAGLVTGNIEEGARIKLARFNLDHYFNFGGYGEGTHHRSIMVKQAIEKAEAHCGRHFEKERIFLFGDTEKDIESAIDNRIIPVLIDHHNRFSEIIDTLPVAWYGTFKRFSKFLEKATETTQPGKLIRF